MIAVCNIRQEPHYRRGAFERGLRAAGYKVLANTERGTPTGRDDLLLLWNRKPMDEVAAASWETKGGTVLVCENGYIGRDVEGRQLYAIAVHGHNGSGWFPVGCEDRFSPLGIPLLPWREGGGHVLVCAQRGIGSRTMASPPQWDLNARRQLVGKTSREVRVRPHPGNNAPKTTLEQDLAGAWACAIWSSSSGVKALTLGIPVLYDAPHWIASGAAGRLRDVELPPCDDARRAASMHRLAHAQWSIAEIENGEPFARIRDNIGAATW